MDRNKYNSNGNKHGYWEEYYGYCTLQYKGRHINSHMILKGVYQNGIKTGLWKWFILKNELYEEAYYL